MKTKLVFESTIEIRQFIKRRKVTHPKIDTTDVTLTAVLSAKDIEIACKDYKARLVR